MCEPPLPKVQSHTITLTLQGCVCVCGGGVEEGLRGKGRGIRCSWAGVIKGCMKELMNCIGKDMTRLKSLSLCMI